MMVDDPKFSESGRADPLVECHHFREDFFLDGPVSRRVVVLAFDEKTGALVPGLPYERTKPGAVLGHYKLAPDPKHPDPTSRAFNQVSALATVLKTIQMFEKEDLQDGEADERALPALAEGAGLAAAGRLWNELGAQLRQVARYAAARAAYERALRIAEAAYGPDHPAVARDVNNLGVCCGPWGSWPGRGRLSSGRWPSTRRPTAPTTRTWPAMSITWEVCCRIWETWPGRGRHSSGRWRLSGGFCRRTT